MPLALRINGSQLPYASLHGLTSTVGSAGSCCVGLFRLFPCCAAARFCAPNVGSFGSLALFSFAFPSLCLFFAVLFVVLFLLFPFSALIASVLV